MKRSIIVEIIVMLFVILFLYTGISKLMDYSVFKEQLAESPVLGPMAKLAIGLPLIEFLTSLLLILPRWRLKGLYVSLALMTLFTGYIITILSFSDQLPCSCGGIVAQLSWQQHVAFNSSFILLALTGIIIEKRLKREKLQWAKLNSPELA